MTHDEKNQSIEREMIELVNKDIKKQSQVTPI